MVYGYSHLLNEIVKTVQDTLNSKNKELGLGLGFSLNSLFWSNHGITLSNSRANSSSSIISMEFISFFQKEKLFKF